MFLAQLKFGREIFLQPQESLLPFPTLGLGLDPNNLTGLVLAGA